MLGTPRKIVARVAAMASATWTGSNFGTGAIAEPLSSGTIIPAVAAKAWNIGKTTRKVSVPGASLRASITESALEMRLRWVSMAPFGRPVVPDV